MARGSLAIGRQFFRRFSSQASDGNSSSSSLFASTVLERLPVILPEPPAWEVDYRIFSFERRQLYRKEYPKEFLDMGSSNRGEEGDIVFEPAPRITDADRTNDIRSLQRALDKRLYLIVNGQPENSEFQQPRWHFPEKIYENEETMRQCAEKALAGNVGTSMETYFVGNAPCGHLSTPSQPNSVRFFFRSQFLVGNVTLSNRRLEDYAWVTKEELVNYVDPQEYEFYAKLLI